MGKVGIVGGNPDMWIKKLERKNLVFDPLHAEIIGYDDEEGAEQEENDMENYPGEVEEYPDEEAEAAEETYPDYPEEEETYETYPEGSYPEDSYETYPEESYPYPPDSGMTFAPYAPQGPDMTAGPGENYPYPPPVQLPPELYSTPPVFPPSPPDPVPTGQLTALSNIVQQSANNFQNKLIAKDPAAVSAFTNLIKQANSNPVAKQVLKIVEKPFVPPTPSGGGLTGLFKTIPPTKPAPPPSPLAGLFKAPPPKPAPSPSGGLAGLFKAPIPPPKPAPPPPGMFKIPVPIAPKPTLPTVPMGLLKGAPKLSVRGEVVMGGQITRAISSIFNLALSPVVWATHGAGTVSKEVGNLLEGIARKL